MEEKKTKTCSYEKYPYQCTRPLYDAEHCIFHSEDIEGKIERFNDEFWKEFKRQNKEEKEFNFRGFVFPGFLGTGRKQWSV